jgi:hypothetical protein
MLFASKAFAAEAKSIAAEAAPTVLMMILLLEWPAVERMAR